MKNVIAKAKLAVEYATDGEWSILIAVCALVVIFITIMTGHVSMKF